MPSTSAAQSSAVGRDNAIDASYYAGPTPSSGPECQECGCAPAISVTLRRNVGMLVWRRYYRLERTLCRLCGVATFRDWQAQTLTKGWWGWISFVSNWYAVFRNLGARAALLRLPLPVSRRTDAAGLRSEPRTLTSPVFARLGPWLATGAACLLVLASFAGAFAPHPRTPSVGSCFSGTQNARVVSCGDSSAAYRVVGVASNQAACPQFQATSYFQRSGDTHYYCVVAN